MRVAKSILFALLLACSVCFAILPAMASAATDVQVALSPSDITINMTETMTVDVVVTNNRNVADTFSVSVWPHTSWAGVTPNLEADKVKVEASSNATIKLYMSASSDAEEIITTFLVTAKSVNFDNVSATSSLTARTVRKYLVYISDISLDRYVLDPEDCVNIATAVTNAGSTVESYKLQTTITSGADIIKKFDNDIDSLAGMASVRVSNSYCFGKYASPGTYVVSSVLKSNLGRMIDVRSANLRMNAKTSLVYSKPVEYTPFAQIKTIIITNEGNTVEKDVYVTETVSDFVAKLLYPVNKPTSIETSDNKIVYTWKIDELRPGASVSIRYEIRFVSIWVSGLVIALVVFLAFTYVYTPRIGKSFVLAGPLKRGKEIPILLELRNATLYEIKNITVSDSIPPLASLLEKFDTMKPEEKKTDAGTSLVWRIKSLKPLEERVLTYRIKTNVDIIGSMRLPKATMEYTNRKRQLKSVFSRALELK